MTWGEVQNELAKWSLHHQNIAQDKTNPTDIVKWATQRMQAFDRAASLAAQMEANGFVFSIDAQAGDQKQKHVLSVVGDTLLVPSSSRVNLVHRATSTACNCEAGLSGKFCLHSALVLAIEAIILDGVAKHTPPNSTDIPF